MMNHMYLWLHKEHPVMSTQSMTIALAFRLINKSDAYSFRVVLMELISSMLAVDMGRSKDEITLGNLALGKIRGNKFEEMMDTCWG